MTINLKKVKWKSFKLSWGGVIGAVILALLTGVGVVVTNKVNGPNSVVETYAGNSLFEQMRNAQQGKSEDENPEFVMSKQDAFVVENKLSTVVNKPLFATDTAYLIAFDKLLLSYYLSYTGENSEEILTGIRTSMEYEPSSMEVLTFEQGKEFYKILKDAYKSKEAKVSPDLDNPNSLRTIINDYLVFVDFVFDKPEHLKTTLFGLGAYLDFARIENPTEEMLQNPNADMCVLAKIHPDMRKLPEELECDF